jgi:hypothetical protein
MNGPPGDVAERASTSNKSERGRIGRAILASGLLVVYVLGMVTTGWFEHRAGAGQVATVEQAALLAAFGWFALLAALLTWRQPRNPMGWIFAAITVLIGVSPVGPAYVDLVLRDGRVASTGLAWLAWPNNWAWPLLLGLMFVYLPLLFPDGHLPSRRWRPVAWLAGMSLGVFCLLGAVAETITTQGLRREIANPIGIPGLAHPEGSPAGVVLGLLLLVGVAGAFVSLLTRLRRTAGLERRQVTWLLYGSGIVVVTVLTEPLRSGLPTAVEDVITGLTFNAVPLAFTVAILRYRLYAIDRIVSRTISYAAVTLALVATYAAGVLVFGQVLSPFGAGNELAIAASTLAVAAIFRPLLRRVRSVVDRRFNRSRYDAQRTVATFAQRLRDEVDLTALSAELRTVVATTVAPRQVGLWLRGGGR